MESGGTCEDCPSGQYQDELSSTSCKQCPEYSTSTLTGLTSRDLCDREYSKLVGGGDDRGKLKNKEKTANVFVSKLITHAQYTYIHTYIYTSLP